MNTNLLSILLTVLSVNICAAQDRLYNPKGQLAADTTLSIDEEQLALWDYNFESHLLSHFSIHFNYPLIALENNIQGEFILEIAVDTNGDLLKILPLSNPGWHLVDSAIAAIESFEGFKRIAGKSDTYIYYIPIKIAFVSKDMRNGYVNARREKQPLMIRGSY